MRRSLRGAGDDLMTPRLFDILPPLLRVLLPLPSYPVYCPIVHRASESLHA